jgi:hypothetical protein
VVGTVVVVVKALADEASSNERSETFILTHSLCLKLGVSW